VSKHQNNLELRLFAAALYQIRVLLAEHIGARTNEPVSAAAELAYVLHNDALNVLAGDSINVPLTLQRIAKLQTLLGPEVFADFERSVLNEVQ
jgi:hypothetical protein